MGKNPDSDKNQLGVDYGPLHQTITKQNNKLTGYDFLVFLVQPIQYLMSGQPRNAA